MANTLARLASTFLIVGSLALPSALRAEDSALTRAAIAMSKQTKRAWGLTLLCTGPIQDNPEASAYFVSKLTYNLWYETRRFIYFTRRPPSNPADLNKLFERLQLIVARVDGMLAPGKGIFLLECPYRDSWELVKERMAAVSQAMGGNLVDKDPPITFPPEEGIETPEDAEEPSADPPAAPPSPAPAPEPSPAAEEPEEDAAQSEEPAPGASPAANPLD